jgi:hypothetical protein
VKAQQHKRYVLLYDEKVSSVEELQLIEMYRLRPIISLRTSKERMLSLQRLGMTSQADFKATTSYFSADMTPPRAGLTNRGSW